MADQRARPALLLLLALGGVLACSPGSGGGTASGTSPSSSEPSPPPPFTNGSFEDGLTGWDALGVRVVQAGLGAFHGSKVLEFDPARQAEGLRFGHARARIVTEPGREYRITLAHQAGFDLGNPLLAIAVDGQAAHDVIATVPFLDPLAARKLPARASWSETSVSFFAERAVTELQIGPLSRWASTIGWGRVWVDHVRVEPQARLRALGADVEVRATLPSDALIGEPLELRVSLLERLRAPIARVFDNRLAHCTVDFRLDSGDPEAVLPERIAFRGEATRVERVRFGSPGVRRVFLRTEDGFAVSSNPVLVHERAPPRRSFWGDIHVHTELGHADWIGGSGALNYLFARDFADLDFAALSEHYGWTAVTGWMDRLVPATLAFDEPGRFATFLAVETSSYQGHHNYYLRSSDPFLMFDGRNPFASRDEHVANLRARGVSFLTIPHHFMLLEPVDWRWSDREALRLAEIYSNHGSSEQAGAWWRHPAHIGNWYGDTKGARGHDLESALRRGHRLGLIGCSDSHCARPGLAGLTCVRASALTREGLFDALRARACYATSGARILLDLELSGATMGQELFLEPLTALEARVAVHAGDPIEAVELVRAGTVVASAHPGTLDFAGTFALGSFSGQPTHLYARARLRDQHRAWSSPIWIDPARIPDLALEKKDLSFDFASGALAVTPRNYGDASAQALLRLYSSADEPSFAEVPVSPFTEPTLLLRVEPVSAGRARLAATLYTPRNLGRTFRFAGQIRLWNAPGYAIAADPRAMLVDDRQGTLRWSDELGMNYRFSESRSGQITDFELVVDTNPLTRLDLSARIDGSPLSEVWVGSEVHPAPLSVALPLGELARTPPLDERTVALDPSAAPAPVVFARLPPGATYIAVLDPEGRVAESDEHDNAATLAVPEQAPAYDHWLDYGR